MDPINTTGICFNVEPGYLEGQAKLLVDSIRTFGGIDMEVPLYAFQPRMSGNLDKSTLSFFESHNVVFQKLPLNKHLFFHPMANKVVMPAYFEANCPDHIETIALFDTDLLFVNKLSQLFEIQNKAFALSPAFSSKFSAIIIDKRPSKIWQIVFEYLNITLDDFWTLKTLIENETIYHYYSGGIIISKKDRNLFSQLWNLYLKIFDDKRLLSISYKEKFFLEQILIAAYLAKNYDESAISKIGKSYHYPLEQMPGDANNANILHYQDYFYDTPPDQWVVSNEVSTMVKKHLHFPKQPKSKVLRAREIMSYQWFKIKTSLR